MVVKIQQMNIFDGAGFLSFSLKLLPYKDAHEYFLYRTKLLFAPA